jgi:hypothetical protein
MTGAGATFSACGVYRYRLWRRWRGDGAPALCFLMLNPSTADEVTNDATVSRCGERATRLGFGALEVVNLFALRSTDPAALYRHHDPVGRENDDAILAAARACKLVICGWGNHGALHHRGRSVLAMLTANRITPHALRLNADGSPAHPLYLPYSLLPTPIP